MATSARPCGSTMRPLALAEPLTMVAVCTGACGPGGMVTRAVAEGLCASATTLPTDATTAAMPAAMTSEVGMRLIHEPARSWRAPMGVGTGAVTVSRPA